MQSRPQSLSFVEAMVSPCSTCATAPCCRYLPLGSFAVDTLTDLDHAAYLLNFPSIELGITADGSWSAYYTQPCRHLDVTSGGCRLHGTPEKPHICVQYNPYTCWYRPALTGPGHADYLRIDRRRFERVLAEIRFDEDRRITEVPSCEELGSLFADLPLTGIATDGPVAAPDPTWEQWQEIALGRKPAPTVEPVAGDAKLTRPDPCTSCAAHCCTKLLFAVAAPTTASSLDYLRFALGFPGVEVVAAEGGWQLAVSTTCRHLAGGRCSLYGDVTRPLRCQFLDAWACAPRAVFEPPRPAYAVRFRLEELPAVAAAFAYDEHGVATAVPGHDQLRAAIEVWWTEAPAAVESDAGASTVGALPA